MDCVNHSGVEATAFCQSCGKALCATCVCSAAGGHVQCQQCWNAWQSYQQPFVQPHSSEPNPAVAAALGIIPGVGAMYNGQFIKGLMHVVIFAVLISMTEYYPLGGLFIAAWVIYQIFEAFHTAKARREGQPLPDPLGLNEVSYWLNPGARMRDAVPPAAASAGQQQPIGGAYQSPYQASNSWPYQPPAAAAPESTPDAASQSDAPIPPPPQMCWRRREPVGAILLIGLGVIFLLGQFNLFFLHWVRFAWPLALIVLGVWLIVRRVGESKGGSL